MKNTKVLNAAWFANILTRVLLSSIIAFSAVPSFAAGSPILDGTESNKIMPASNSSAADYNQNAVDIMNLVESASAVSSAKKNASKVTTAADTLVPGAEVSGTLRGSTLTILGTNKNDNIKITQNNSIVTVTTSTGVKTFIGAIDKIDIYGFDGDDVINVTSSVSSHAGIYGGSGNDQLFADAGISSVLDGGTGDDLLVGLNDDNAVDTFIGGDGLDSFWAATNAIINNFSSDEAASNSIHRISQFYQPFTTDQSSSKYTSLSLSGQDLADPTDSGATFNVSLRPLFNNGTVYYNDIQQGLLGDCYFLAGLASLTQTYAAYCSARPEVLLQSIAPLGDGTYGVRFFRDGVANYLRIDGDVPVYNYGDSTYIKYAGFGTGGDIWAMLLEKAFAFFQYPGDNTYDSLNGGYLDEPFTALTGLRAGNYGLAGSSDSTVYNFLQTQLSKNYAITLASNYNNANSEIIGSHAYSLRSVQKIGGKLYATIYNPWGADGVAYDSNPKDGLLTITVAELKKRFNYVSVSSVKIGPVKNTVSLYQPQAKGFSFTFWNYYKEGSKWDWFWSNLSNPQDKI